MSEVRTQVPASVASERRDGHRPHGRRGFRVQPLQQRVDTSRIPLDRHPSSASASGLVAELAACGLEHGQRSGLIVPAGHCVHVCPASLRRGSERVQQPAAIVL